MAKKLVIVESPTKSKIIKKLLGPEYEVEASKGHVRDLPERSLGIDIEKGFAPRYEVSADRKAVVVKLKKLAKEAEAIYLAPDPDREGEAIAWHLCEALKTEAKGKPVYRVQYNEITKRAVTAAFAEPGEIDMARVDAQQARRVLDRIVGYKVSPMLWRRLRKGLSAGRVQSVALRLVAERERRISAFRPVEYFVLGAKAARPESPADSFVTRLARIDGQVPVTPKEGDDTPPTIAGEAAARALLADLEGAQLKVAEIKDRELSRRPLPPFITSTLQQAASSVLGIDPKRTMSLAQKLFEGGLITYMRTDSVNVSVEARAAARGLITSQYGALYAAENFYKSASGAQQAHEAIRPTDVTQTPETLEKMLDSAELRLYELIWKRFLASQMAAAKIRRRTVLLDAEKAGLAHAYLFSASASEVAFDGFLRVMALDIRKKKADADDEAEEDDEIDRLPQLAEGDRLSVVEWLSERKETKPPARFSEASLVKALEANGVGRPSTYASIIDTLKVRKYVSHEKRQLIPTELGLNVNDLLVDKLPGLFDVSFTASMEAQLDEVEEGKLDWREMLGKFYESFRAWMEAAKEPPADLEKVKGVLALLEKVREWAEPVQRGKRVYSDEAFTSSVREQLAAGEKPVSAKQLSALVSLALRYREQIAGGEESLTALGFGEELAREKAAPDAEAVAGRFQALDALALDGRQKMFVDSFRKQFETRRRLSERQLQVLDSIVAEHAAEISNYDELKSRLGLSEPAADGKKLETVESPLVIAALAQVKEWAAPVSRGKRTYDDAAFFKSVSEQFARSKGLSPRQLRALKSLLKKYKAQIADYEVLMERLSSPSLS